MAITIYTIEAYVGRPVDFKNNEVTLRDDGDGNGVYIDVWDVDGKTKPTADQLATHDAAETAFKALEVVRWARHDAYLSAGDQLDMQYHDGENGTTTWKDHVAAVKAAHPLP